MSGSTTHLPAHPAQPLAELPQRLRDALGSNLASVILHAGGASGSW